MSEDSTAGSGAEVDVVKLAALQLYLECLKAANREVLAVSEPYDVVDRYGSVKHVTVTFRKVLTEQA